MRAQCAVHQAKQTPLTLRQLPQPCREAMLESWRVAGLCWCCTVPGCTGAQQPAARGMGLERVGIFREKELGNMGKTNLSWGETLRDAWCVRAWCMCVILGESSSACPLKHMTVLGQCSWALPAPSELGEVYSVPNTTDVPRLLAQGG